MIPSAAASAAVVSLLELVLGAVEPDPYGLAPAAVFGPLLVRDVPPRARCVVDPVHAVRIVGRAEGAP